MHVIKARNVHQALPQGLAHLAAVGVPMPSRAGDVLVAPGPVTTVYERPTERVLFWPERDANPFFHMFEALWMLGGRNDLTYLTQFVKRFTDFSDDGKILHGAYGYRWRHHWDFDQVARVIAYLKRNPLGRRGVISMWDPAADLREDEVMRDVPCNVTIMFTPFYGRRDEPNQLHMTVINRSNDIIWGLYGANAAHMSMLQEYVATHLGLVVGNMTTISNNFHAYKDIFDKTYRGNLGPGGGAFVDPYSAGEVTPYPLIQDPTSWDRDLALFFEDPHSYGFENKFFHNVAKPMWFAHRAYKKKDIAGALEIIQQCQALDWRRAAREWLERRTK